MSLPRAFVLPLSDCFRACPIEILHSRALTRIDIRTRRLPPDPSRFPSSVPDSLHPCGPVPSPTNPSPRPPPAARQHSQKIQIKMSGEIPVFAVDALVVDKTSE
ncbi:hypothetical protein BDN70DRAFT_877560 [Pholiota conissans]|uniref:Uncharacterized protein n=1 Tax=Pholiota conissans TaxID=109636 RepID=A0A9P5Z3F7_9AGAR|nr:hypothetical protein BDN70DRAFT_877560 [Pholiota conissans]